MGKQPKLTKFDPNPICECEQCGWEGRAMNLAGNGQGRGFCPRCLWPTLKVKEVLNDQAKTSLNKT